MYCIIDYMEPDGRIYRVAEVVPVSGVNLIHWMEEQKARGAVAVTECRTYKEAKNYEEYARWERADLERRERGE